MKVFAISDLHYCQTNPEKDMVRFGEEWRNHHQKIKSSWLSLVGEDDIVLIPGDICWATSFHNGLQELAFIDVLPGEKIFVKGNHDFWWDSISKVRKQSPARMHFIQNDSVVLGDYAFAGTRLWAYEFVKWPSVVRNLELDKENKDKPEVDKNWLEKVRKREYKRLENSLASIPEGVKHRIAMIHFPPIDDEGNPNFLTELMTQYKVDTCIFGHLHSVAGNPKGSDCVINETRYRLVSCDFLNFELARIV